MSKKPVAIIGMAKRHRHLAPWDNPDIEIWALNESYNAAEWFPGDEESRLPRWDRWYQIHQRWDFTRPNNMSDPNHFEWLKKAKGFPIYMQEVYDDIPESTPFPIDDILAMVKASHGQNPAKYLTSTMALMIAHAILEERPWIEIYGVEAGSSTEYDYQKGSIERWIGFAEGRGIPVILPDNCGLMSGLLYGYEGVRYILPEVFEQRLKVIDTYIEKAKEGLEVAQLSHDMRQTPETASALIDANGYLNLYLGGKEENEYWIDTVADGAPGHHRQHFELRRAHIGKQEQKLMGQLHVVIGEHKERLVKWGAAQQAALPKRKRHGQQDKPQPVTREVREEFAQMMAKFDELGNMAAQVNFTAGHRQECERYMHMIDMREVGDEIPQMVQLDLA